MAVPSGIPELTEVISQPYADGAISAGFVGNVPHDSVYIRLTRAPTSEDILLTLRPDEVAALAWCANGLLWSLEMSRLLDDEQPST